MPNFRPFSACWGDISFTEAPHTTTRCYAGAIFLSCNPSKHPHRGGHRRNRAHLETQSLAAVLVGGGGAWPDNEPTHRAHISDQAPLVWRAPEGPEGTGGLRDRPLRAAGSRVAISRAAGPDGARNTSGATQQQHGARTAGGRAAAHRHTQRPGPTKQPGPTAGPDGTRNTSGATSTAGNQAISGSRAPSGSPTLRQHPSARAGAPNRRQPARGPRPRR